MTNLGGSAALTRGFAGRRRMGLVADSLLLGALLLTGCGGGGNGSSSGTPCNQTGTPASTYTVNAIATANGVRHITPVTLTVR